MLKKISELNTAQFRVSFFYYVGNFVLNFFRYLFHLVLLRFLAPAEYGEFLSYLSLMYLLSVPSGTISTLVTKFIASYKGSGDSKSINVFFEYLVKKTAPVGVVVGLILISFSNPLATLFKAHPLAFVVLGVSAFVTLFQTITASFLAGFQRFVAQTILGFVNTLLTITFSIAFIKFGLGATGAVLGQIISGILITIVTLYLIKDSIFPFVKTTKKPNLSLKKFTIYSFIFSLGTMSLISTDILIFRILFDTHASGMYSSLSILGRMILFGLTPVISLVLPMVSLRHSQNNHSESIFIKLGLSLLGLGLFGSMVFSFFSKSIVSILSGNQYLSISHLLPVFAFSMVFFALSQFILSYLMATGREKSNIILLAITLIQPVVLYLYGRSLDSFVWLNMLIHVVLLFAVAYYFISSRKTAVKFTHG